MKIYKKDVQHFIYEEYKKIIFEQIENNNEEDLKYQRIEKLKELGDKIEQEINNSLSHLDAFMNLGIKVRSNFEFKRAVAEIGRIQRLTADYNTVITRAHEIAEDGTQKQAESQTSTRKVDLGAPPKTDQDKNPSHPAIKSKPSEEDDAELINQKPGQRAKDWYEESIKRTYCIRNEKPNGDQVVTEVEADDSEQALKTFKKINPDRKVIKIISSRTSKMDESRMGDLATEIDDLKLQFGKDYRKIATELKKNPKYAKIPIENLDNFIEDHLKHSVHESFGIILKDKFSDAVRTVDVKAHSLKEAAILAGKMNPTWEVKHILIREYNSIIDVGARVCQYDKPGNGTVKAIGNLGASIDWDSGKFSVVPIDQLGPAKIELDRKTKKESHAQKKSNLTKESSIESNFLDDLKANFRSWEELVFHHNPRGLKSTDQDHEEDANELYGILMGRHPKENPEKLKAAAYHWVGAKLKESTQIGERPDVDAFVSDCLKKKWKDDAILNALEDKFRLSSMNADSALDNVKNNFKRFKEDLPAPSQGDQGSGLTMQPDKSELKETDQRHKVVDSRGQIINVRDHVADQVWRGNKFVMPDPTKVTPTDTFRVDKILSSNEIIVKDVNTGKSLTVNPKEVIRVGKTHMHEEQNKHEPDLLAYQTSEWSWEYDHNIRIAKVFKTSNEKMFKLVVTETHIKSGIGAGTTTQTLFDGAVKLNEIDPIAKKYSHDKSGRSSNAFSRNKWTSAEDRSSGTLSQILAPQVGKIKNVVAQRTQESESNFEKQTGLAPDIIADTVIEELEQYYREPLDPNLREKIIRDIVSKSNLIVANKDFIKKVSKGNEGRARMYEFVRHWISSLLKNNFNGKKLPIEFSNGKQPRI